MANNSIGAYAQGGSNDIGAYEKAIITAIVLNVFRRHIGFYYG